MDKIEKILGLWLFVQIMVGLVVRGFPAPRPNHGKHKDAVASLPTLNFQTREDCKVLALSEPEA